jgi:imidazolonepropionase-like amidohydrolase
MFLQPARLVAIAATIGLAGAAANSRNAVSSQPIQSGGTTVIHAATVLDGRGGTLHNSWVVVRGGRIERISASAVSIPGAKAIELGDATLLPGLIDAHVHPGWYVDRNGKRNSPRNGDTP